jgi:hypothetical protein
MTLDTLLSPSVIWPWEMPQEDDADGNDANDDGKDPGRIERPPTYRGPVPDPRPEKNEPWVPPYRVPPRQPPFERRVYE